MAKSIYIDLDKLEKAIEKYEDLIEDFEESIKKTEKAIELLRTSGWKTGASTQYFLTYEDTWKQNMEKRMKIIKHLKKCLVKAQKEYSDVYEELELLDSVL